MPRALIALACLIVSSHSAPAMVGGAGSAPPSVASSVVLIVGSRGNFCTGTALAPDLVLTVAHCVLPGADYKIVQYDAARTPLLRDVSRVIAHPKFDLKTMLGHRATADVALLKLARLSPAWNPQRSEARAQSRPAMSSWSRARVSRKPATASPAEPCAPQRSPRPADPEPCRSASSIPRPRANARARRLHRRFGRAGVPRRRRPLYPDRGGELVDRARELGRVRRSHRRYAVNAVWRMDHAHGKNAREPNLILQCTR